MEKYFKFDGTSQRSEFWAVTLINAICAIILVFAAAAIMTIDSTFAVALGVVALIVTIIISYWVTVANCIRRCKDAGINPWWTLAIIIPYVGTVVFIVLGCLKTDEAGK